MKEGLAACRHSRPISSARRSIHSYLALSFVLATICLTLAAPHGAPAQDAPQQVAAEKPPLANYLNAKTGVQYVGDQVCGSCHSLEYKLFKQTAMGRSASVPSPDDLKALAKPVTFSSDTLNRTYTVYARNGRMYHEESERDAKGQLVFSEIHEVAYTVGAGEVGKSYLVARAMPSSSHRFLSTRG